MSVGRLKPCLPRFGVADGKRWDKGAKRASWHGILFPPLPNWHRENSAPCQSFYAPFLFSSPGFVVGKLAPNNFNFPNLEHQIYGKQYQMETFQSFAVLLSLKNISTTLHVFISLPNTFPRCRNLVVVSISRISLLFYSHCLLRFMKWLFISDVHQSFLFPLFTLPGMGIVRPGREGLCCWK